MKKKHIYLFILIVWLGVIFVMSSFNASLSSNQSNFVVRLIHDIIPSIDIEILKLGVRKVAHFTEYFILGILLYKTLFLYKKQVYSAIPLGVIYAISDEIHQYFVPGRVADIMDVLIDSMGLLVGIVIIKYFKRR